MMKQFSAPLVRLKNNKVRERQNKNDSAAEIEQKIIDDSNVSARKAANVNENRQQTPQMETKIESQMKQKKDNSNGEKFEKLKIGNKTKETRSKMTKKPPKEIRYDRTDHLPGYHANPSRRRCRLEGCSLKTNYYCIKCNVNLCVEEKNCFIAFHTAHHN